MDWRLLPPEELLLYPELLASIPPYKQGSEALAYARSGGGLSYDELGFRFAAALPARGQFALVTMPEARRVRSVSERARPDARSAERVRQAALLKHRAIELPAGAITYAFEGDFLRVTRADAPDPGNAHVWTFSLSAPPDSLLADATEGDEVRLPAHLLKASLPGVHWIPYPLLLETGHFQRMQSWRERLVEHDRLSHDSYFLCFVSHRWLSTAHPDPTGDQAALVAWQLLAHLNVAVRVAKKRGLHVARTISAALGRPIGVRGTDLAEALIVNLLRISLDERLLEQAWAEACSIAALTRDFGLAAAHCDRGLSMLRETLARCPRLSALLERVHLWYDYGAVPQEPRTPEEQLILQSVLERLQAIQMLSRTIVLLSDPEDYLSRGWCALEALCADNFGQHCDLLVDASRPGEVTERVEHEFEMLLADRPHLVWRAVLDTEVFAVQPPERCLARLNLEVTEARDRQYVYDGMVTLGAPSKIHLDAGELLTGLFPLPVVGSRVVVPRETKRVLHADKHDHALSLDWSQMLRLRGNEDDKRPVDCWLERSLDGTLTTCHVAVIGSCEGEAALLAGRVSRRTGELESLIGARVASISWLACDIAPVGHMLDGSFKVVAVPAASWVLVALHMRFAYCPTTCALRNALDAAELPYLRLAIDRPSQNLVASKGRGTAASHAPACGTRAVEPGSSPLVDIPGGVFRSALLTILEAFT